MVNVSLLSDIDVTFQFATMEFEKNHLTFLKFFTTTSRYGELQNE
jgi:hypothetical protein